MQTIGQVENSDADNNEEFTEGDPLKAIPASKVSAQWLNSQQRELVNLIQGLGTKLNPNDDSQLSQRLRELTPLRHLGAIANHHGLAGFNHYPHIASQSQHLEIIQHDAWKIEIAPGQTFNWRGVWRIDTDAFSTLERSFELAPNSTYHLRWRSTDSFLLLHLQDAAYNPQDLKESNPSFDTTFDDMLIARISSDEQGITEIVTLRNSQHLLTQFSSKQSSLIEQSATGALFSDVKPVASLALQWARTPRAYWQGVSALNFGSQYRGSLNLALHNRCRFGVDVTREKALLYDSYERGKSDQPTWHYVLRA